MNTTSYVPQIDKKYIPWGIYKEVETIIKSKRFYPTWINGDTGNGKTAMIEQACAKTGRELIRINFTTETDENDIIGGVNLVAGDKGTFTDFQDGPAVTAARLGAVLLLDEIDAAHTNKILCLQSLLEGKGVLIKKTGEFVKPAKGFTIFATGNTQGKGSFSGRFIGTQIMNSAFMDRFAGMLLQTYPDKTTEETILRAYYAGTMEEMEIDPTTEQLSSAGVFIGKLIGWAEIIRKLYAEGDKIPEVITTRSLINIVNANAIFNDEKQAVAMACGRYQDEVKIAFLDNWQKLYGNDAVGKASPLINQTGSDWMKFQKPAIT